MKPIVVIVGMNRSGTSLLCQALERLGASFGSPLIEADKANPRGYYEHRDIVHHQTVFMQECHDRRGWNTIGPLEMREDKLDIAEVQELALRAVVEREVGSCELFGVKTTYWPRVPELWWSIVDDYEPIFFHALRKPYAVLTSILRANETESKLTPKREREFYRQWAWHNAECFELGGTEVWFDEWYEDVDGVMARIAGALGREPVSTEGLLL